MNYTCEEESCNDENNKNQDTNLRSYQPISNQKIFQRDFITGVLRNLLFYCCMKAKCQDEQNRCNKGGGRMDVLGNISMIFLFKLYYPLSL